LRLAERLAEALAHEARENVGAAARGPALIA
jgi:hypothetical protein